MADQLKIGDTVELKSGGPDMTVIDVLPNGLIMCAWFDRDKSSKETFPPDALKKTGPDAPFEGD